MALRPQKREPPQMVDPQVCDKSPYPFNFSKLREGCIDPCLNKTVHWLISSDDDYIVYVDQDFYVEWTMNDNSVLDENGALLTRVGQLESAQTNHLTLAQVETFKRLIGEAIARLFEKNTVAAEAALNAAELWIRARGQEAARITSLQGATVTFGIIVVLFTIGWFRFGAVIDGTRSMLALGANLGAVGAWLSVLQRTGREDLDIGAGKQLFLLEGMVRIAIGTVSGLFVALLLQAGWLLPQNTRTPTLFAAMCLVAGLSERLVNSLATELEGKAHVQGPTTTTTTTGAQQPSPSARSKSSPLAQPKRPIAEPDGIVSLSPQEATAGDSLVIEGHKFGDTAGKVTIGGASAAVNEWSDTSIHVTVPSVPAGLTDVSVEPSSGERPFVVNDGLRMI